MSKAEKFILENTNDGSIDITGWHKNGLPIYKPWLSPYVAIRAVEIAREEVIEKVCEFLDNDLCCYIKAQDFAIEHQRLKNDLKQAINDE